MTPIEISNVDSIKLIPHFPDDTIGEPPIKLNDHNTKVFIEDLNKAHSDGVCKYYPYYNIIVYMKNGEQKSFRANGKHIKQDKDECFVIGNEEYFGKLYNDNKKGSH